MLPLITQRAGFLNLLRSTLPPSFTHVRRLCTTDSHVCNSYTRILQCHPGIRTIEQVHARVLVEGSSQNSFCATHLVKSYAKTGNIHAAHLVFGSVPKKTVFLWNAIIRACSGNGLWLEITQLYRQMEEERVEPDSYTLPFVIKAFAFLHSLEEGKRMHSLANQTGLLSNLHVATALIEMYLEFDEVNIARKIFDGMLERDVVTWTSMISGYVDSGNHMEALSIFREMRIGDDKPNWVTVLCLIPACHHSIHAFVTKSGLDFYVEVETAILDMYAKGGDVVTARSLFDRIPERSLISWTAMVSGYSQNGYAHEALLLFQQMMKVAHLKPDVIITASALQASAQLGSLGFGEMMHGYIIRVGAQIQLLVGTALVDLYAKCGSISAAQMVFDEIDNPNMIAWSTLIAAYGHHGLGSKALDLLGQMKQNGFVPDETAFVSVLSACSHSGLVHEGLEHFASMVQTYKLLPKTKHYACMVDLLGRAGLVDEACNLIKTMQVEPDANVWGALLSACRAKGNASIAEFAFRRLLELEPDNVEYHVLLANIYAGCGRWDEASKLRSVSGRKGERKTPGCSSVQVNCDSN
ncbi:pentatricopeptide repeat-containing protein At3g12770-like [Macadamia integrifolia]|uniref:pentatricopeptide repeat-containing protein At3g12770-like n=1 Tax=Macadamia integrifolia TaxID=60698 RepID=UPI001C4F7570|nr:pentatricopeptide repeat-containing protein At3g12770-like [Macadamia integrifolia]XP_042490180.1 pentatricopeptide repeat-containing protein At3g12770-like [Macadamia integrifolia]XP_042490187.1 pentatricopeptide repeat-containing protein At3g12770-like [Macadamia integrifolia]XP_042490192.1 pentatricopeptide repeat-containing protein At3g12770-like [Macadamia integrifolia]XP_042490202.1 pentatricopeptide repeat-containing protein At3g12770-like [Macadamia integrifolia]